MSCLHPALLASNTDLRRRPILLLKLGDEVTVGIIGNSPPAVLGIMCIVPKLKNDRFVYSLEVKRDYQNLVNYECPAQLGEEILEKNKAICPLVISYFG